MEYAMRTNTAEEKIIYSRMVEADPRIAVVRRNAVNSLANRDDFGYEFWTGYEAIKKQLRVCVGWDCPDTHPEFMWTSESWDIAFREIFEGIF
jgi:hypothetical protein